MGLRPPTPLKRWGEQRLLYAATTLTPVLKSRLYGYKFYQRRDNAVLLAEILAHYWRSLNLGSNDTLVVPIPPHGNKGNTLTPLVRRFAAESRCGAFLPLLRWQREAQKQHRLFHRQARWQNLHQALAVDDAQLKALGKPPTMVLIVDDLTTTGATLTEAIRAVGQAFPQAIVLGLALSHLPFRPSQPTQRRNPDDID